MCSSDLAFGCWSVRHVGKLYAGSPTRPALADSRTVWHMTAPLLRRITLGRALAGVLLALTCSPLAACGSPTEEPPSPETSEAPANPDAPPFAVKLEGPDTAHVGDEVTVTLTNAGRLPDAYQLAPEPLGAAKIATPNIHASPDESVDVKVTINVARSPEEAERQARGEEIVREEEPSLEDELRAEIGAAMDDR